MTQRIRPADLDTSPYKELLQTLTLQWVNANVPASKLTFQDYTAAIRTLLLTTQSLDQTTTIFIAVLHQAVALGKSSEWIDQELKFEGMIHGADRTDFLRFELQHAREVDDTLLDSYNERINRFTSNDA